MNLTLTRATLLIVSLTILRAHPATAASSSLATEPGVIAVEDLLDQPVRLQVAKESRIYYSAEMDRVLGMMAPGTVVSLVAMTDTAYRVRGRARHGDVAGWMPKADLQSSDPNLHDNLKKLFERQQKVQALIAANEVALGMTVDEVEQSLGKPSRRSSRVTAAGREDSLEYSTYDRVPQVVTGRDPLGRIVQSVVYVKVETGSLSVTFKDRIVTAIEEKKGNPLGNGGVKIVVPPVILR